MLKAISVPIGELVDPVETWAPSRQAPKESFTYVDLSSVDQDTKEIASGRHCLGKDAPSRARQILKTGDVLVSTVRPNLNGVAFVTAPFDGATASTGFCVLRPKPVRLNSKYLFHWVRSPLFVEDMVRKATGASYPAVSDRVVCESTIPVPSAFEQQRIVDTLDRADAIRAKRRAATALIDSLVTAIFIDMFGDPTANPKSFPKGNLPSLGSLDRGVSKHRPRNAPELLGGPYPFVQTGDVANCDGYIRTFSSTYSEVGLRQSKMWPAGTLCITIAANIAKTGILRLDACFPDSVVGFRSDEETVEFVRCWLSFLQASLEEQAPESAQKNINLAILRNLELPIPSRELRRLFAQRVKSIETVKERQLAALAESHILFASLQQAAFSGQI